MAEHRLHMFFGAEFGFDEQAHPDVTRWRDRIADLPGWRHPYALMPGA